MGVSEKNGRMIREKNTMNWGVGICLQKLMIFGLSFFNFYPLILVTLTRGPSPLKTTFYHNYVLCFNPFGPQTIMFSPTYNHIFIIITPIFFTIYRPTLVKKCLINKAYIYINQYQKKTSQEEWNLIFKAIDSKLTQVFPSP